MYVDQYAAKRPIFILLLNGAKYNLDKIRTTPGEVITIEREKLDTTMNFTPLSIHEMQQGVHSIVAEMAPEGKNQYLSGRLEAFIPDSDHAPAVLKYNGKFLLLLGHESSAVKSNSEKLKVRLLTTVAIKEKAKIHDVEQIEAPVPASKPWPQKTYPQEFSNKPRFHPTPKPNLHEPSSRPARAKR